MITSNVYSTSSAQNKAKMMSKFSWGGAFSWYALPSEYQLLELSLLELDNKITPCSNSYSVHSIKRVTKFNLRRLIFQGKISCEGISYYAFPRPPSWIMLCSKVCFTPLLSDFHKCHQILNLKLPLRSTTALMVLVN